MPLRGRDSSKQRQGGSAAEWPKKNDRPPLPTYFFLEEWWSPALPLPAQTTLAGARTFHSLISSSLILL